MLINGLGATATGITLLVVLVAKFLSGAWVVVLLLPVLLVIFVAVRRHYADVAVETACPTPLAVGALRLPIVVVPIQHWNMQAHKALRFALKISDEIYAVHMVTSDQDVSLQQNWPTLVEAPAQAAGLTPPQLIVRDSPYRRVIGPLISFIDELRDQHAERQIAVIIPELVERRWYHYLLHNQRAQLLKTLLMLRGGPHIIVITVPWYLQE